MITFHKILAGCEAGSHEAWRLFLSEYTPFVFHLFDVYLPTSRRGRQEFWQESLADLARNSFERLRDFDHQAEREFLVGLRKFLLERGRAALDSSLDASGAPRPTGETVSALLKGLPLLHQEILLLKLAGYSDRSIEKMLRIAPAVAQKGLDRLQADYGAILRKEQDRCLWPAAWLVLLHDAWTAQTEACPSLRQFVRVQDGQVSWYDKDPAEQHLSGCLHCLERWTGLREVVYARRELKPRPAEEVQTLLSSLPLRAGLEAKKSFLGRLWAKD